MEELKKVIDKYSARIINSTSIKIKLKEQIKRILGLKQGLINYINQNYIPKDKLLSEKEIQILLDVYSSEVFAKVIHKAQQEKAGE